ncbi:hypothetical protein [Peribacillus butanolivorans]|uniref:hypothetical protein n=1 Tax=Peribacillus butanolivorans TaxID=421767 RepID=UPI00366B8FD4
MNLHKQELLLDLLDSQTITALKQIYGITLRHLAARLDLTPQAIHYGLKNSTLKAYQKMAIYQAFKDRGLEISELILIHTMLNKGKWQ